MFLSISNEFVVFRNRIGRIYWWHIVLTHINSSWRWLWLGQISVGILLWVIVHILVILWNKGNCWGTVAWVKLLMLHWGHYLRWKLKMLLVVYSLSLLLQRNMMMWEISIGLSESSLITWWLACACREIWIKGVVAWRLRMAMMHGQVDWGYKGWHLVSNVIMKTASSSTHVEIFWWSHLLKFGLS